MSVTSHLQELRKKHDALSMRVEEAQRQPGTDALQISAMKRQKLRIKEEIEKFSD